MKTYVSLIPALLIFAGCKDPIVEKDPNVDMPALCTKRAVISEARDKSQALFLACVNAPRRVATATDDEAGIVEECRIATAGIHGISAYDDIFMSKTAVYATDCEALK